MAAESAFKNLVLVVLTIAFLVGFYVSIKELLARRTGSSVKLEKLGYKWPEFTICPMFYNKELLTPVHRESGLTFPQLEKAIPSMLDQLVAAKVLKNYQYSGAE